MCVQVRDPYRRFASAFTEIVRRVFTGVCPDGPCEQHRDAYYTAGFHDSADDLAIHTQWHVPAAPTVPRTLSLHFMRALFSPWLG
jgi:hypothetical protein